MFQKFSHHKNGFVSFQFNWQGQIRIMKGVCIFGKGFGFSKTAKNCIRKNMIGAQADW